MRGHGLTMPPELKGLYKLGGVAFVISGVLFLSREFLELMAGPPAIPVIAMLHVVHGRLVYPVYGIRVSSPAVAENIVAVFYGGMHAVGLTLGIATSRKLGGTSTAGGR